MYRGSEVRGRRSEVRGQRTEIRDQRTEVGGQRSEVRGQRSEIRGAGGPFFALRATQGMEPLSLGFTKHMFRLTSRRSSWLKLENITD